MCKRVVIVENMCDDRGYIRRYTRSNMLIVLLCGPHFFYHAVCLRGSEAS